VGPRGRSVRVVEVVKVVEMRRSELPWPDHGPALCSLLSESRARSARAAAKAAASIASERPWPGARASRRSRGGCDFRGRHCLRRAASASARCLRLARRPPCRRFRGCRAQHLSECVVVANLELVLTGGGESGEGQVAGISASTAHCTCASICVALMAASLWCF
jgi:hypothetical protein